MNFLPTISGLGLANVVLFFVVIPFVYFYDSAAVALRFHDAAGTAIDDSQYARRLNRSAEEITSLVYVFRLPPLLLLALLAFAFALVFLGEAVVTEINARELTASKRVSLEASKQNLFSQEAGERLGMKKNVHVPNQPTVHHPAQVSSPAMLPKPLRGGQLVHVYSIFVGLSFVLYLKWCKSTLVWCVTGNDLYATLDAHAQNADLMPPSGFYIPQSSAIVSFFASCVDDLQREACEKGLNFVSAIDHEIESIERVLAEGNTDAFTEALLRLTRDGYELLKNCDVDTKGRWVASESIVNVLRDMDAKVLKVKVEDSKEILG